MSWRDANIIKKKSTKNHTVTTVPESIRIIVERNDNRYRSLAWLDTGTSIQSAGVKLVFSNLQPHFLVK